MNLSLTSPGLFPVSDYRDRRSRKKRNEVHENEVKEGSGKSEVQEKGPRSVKEKSFKMGSEKSIKKLKK